MYVELARETSTQKLYTDELQWSCEAVIVLQWSRIAWGRSFTPNIRRSLPARLYVFITQSKKSKLRQWFIHVLITQLDKNLTLAWLMIS